MTVILADLNRFL